MKALTLRKLPPDLVRMIERRARAQGVSLTRAVVQLLEEGVGSRREKPRASLHHDLDALAGAWTAEEAAAFDAALARQRAIDPELWK